MKTIFRKIGTLARLLASLSGWRTIATQVRKNLRRFTVQRHNGKPFRYVRSDGVPFVCIPESATSVHEYVENGGYEEVELDICRSWLRPGDACFDIGANIGLMAASFAARVGVSGVVISVEPAPSTNAFLRQGMGILSHDNILVEAVCVADKPGEVPFMTAIGNGSDVEASMKVSDQRSGEFLQVIVPAVTIDGLIEKHGIAERLAMVKIDIEGAEPMAFQGGRRLFDRDKLPLFVAEVHRAALANFGLGPMDILRFFPTEMFELFHVQRSRSDLTPRFEYGRIYPLPDPARASVAVVLESDRRAACGLLLWASDGGCVPAALTRALNGFDARQTQSYLDTRDVKLRSAIRLSCVGEERTEHFS